MKTALAALFLLSLGLLAWASQGPALGLDEFEFTSGEAGLADEDPSAPPTFRSDSPVFRMRSKAAAYGDVEVTLELLDKGLSAGAEQHAWDGLHVWLRYQNPAYLYAVSFNRRDDRVVIKKKIPGGSSYGGTYFDLCKTAAFAVPYGRWQRVSAAAVNQPDGSVKLTLRVNGKLLLEAVDDGTQGGAPITDPGRIGLRADNADFEWRGLAARPLGGSGGSR